MPETSQVARDQPRRPAAGALHLDVVVELQSEQIDVTEPAGDGRRPRTQIRGVADRPAVSLEAKATRQRVVVRHREGPALHRTEGDRLVEFEVVNVIAVLQARDGVAPAVQRGLLAHVTVKRYASPGEVL